jgi:glycosyltransferase involved in cell wall biosynthesis
MHQTHRRHVIPRRRLRVIDVINTDWSARELLHHRVRQVNETGRYTNEILCAGGEHMDWLRAHGHTVHDVAVPRGASPWALLRAIRTARHIFRERGVDLVHVHGTTAWLVGAVAAKLEGIPVVAQVHGFHHHENMSALVRRAVLLCERVLCSLSDRLLYQNPADIDECRHHRLAPNHKNRLIGNGVQLGDFPVLAPPDGDPPVILCVSRLEPVKNLPMLIEAARILHERNESFRVRIVGEGPQRAELERRVAEAGLGEVVELLGYRTDVPKLIAESDVCALVSLKEGLPRAIIEAGACARPVVATDVIGNRDAVADGETGFLVPLGDCEALADRLSRLIGDRGLRHYLGRTAREYAEFHFDEQLITELIVRNYDELLGQD